MMYSYADDIPGRIGVEMALNGKRITRLRKKKNWKEEDLAKAIGSTQQTVSRYETGSRQPPADILAKLATALNTSIDYLCGKTNNPDPLSVSQMRTSAEYSVMHLFRTGALDLDKLTNSDKFRNLDQARQKAIKRQLGR